MVLIACGSFTSFIVKIYSLFNWVLIACGSCTSFIVKNIQFYKGGLDCLRRLYKIYRKNNWFILMVFDCLWQLQKMFLQLQLVYLIGFLIIGLLNAVITCKTYSIFYNFIYLAEIKPYSCIKDTLNGSCTRFSLSYSWFILLVFDL